MTKENQKRIPGWYWVEPEFEDTAPTQLFWTGEAFNDREGRNVDIKDRKVIKYIHWISPIVSKQVEWLNLNYEKISNGITEILNRVITHGWVNIADLEETITTNLATWFSSHVVPIPLTLDEIKSNILVSFEKNGVMNVDWSYELQTLFRLVDKDSLTH